MGEWVELSDEEVVVVVRDRDREAYGEIIRRYQNKLMRYARYLTKDEDIAADVVQESLVKAYTHLQSFDEKRTFSSWIYRIVHNQALHVLEKEAKKMPLLEGMIQDAGVDLEAEYEKEELVQMVRACLNDLPIHYREPLSLYYLEEKSYVEISDILRVPVGTVGTRINRGKEVIGRLCLKKNK